MIVNITLYLDTRRPKSNGKYPVKLRIYYNNVTKHYRTGYDATKEEFFNAYESKKPRKEFAELRIKFKAIENKAQESAEGLNPFSFEKFERKQFGNTNDAGNICAYYKKHIERLRNEERFGTANSYELSLKSILRFKNKGKGVKDAYLAFHEVTPEFLIRYEKWMQENERGLTTVGIYLRCLRAVFNMAIQEGDIKLDIYPFGKRKYLIPAGRKVKKALSKDDLKTLFNYQLPKDSEQAKARDFWFFSYQCNGMNIKDILELKYKNIQGNSIVYSRSKTRNTTKTDSKPIIVPITDYVKRIIEKHGNSNANKENYIFPIYQNDIAESEKLGVKLNFIRFVNQHIKKLAEAVGVTTEISTYWARHSFTTNAIRSGATLEFIQDSLGHKDMKTTMNYWSGFEESVKRDISEKIMDFI